MEKLDTIDVSTVSDSDKIHPIPSWDTIQDNASKNGIWDLRADAKSVSFIALGKTAGVMVDGYSGDEGGGRGHRSAADFGRVEVLRKGGRGKIFGNLRQRLVRRDRQFPHVDHPNQEKLIPVREGSAAAALFLLAFQTQSRFAHPNSL
jgi:hypothetical protein